MQKSSGPLPTRTLVVGVDGSPGAAAAMRWAIGQARAVDARIIATYVMTIDEEFLHDMAPAGFTNWRQRIDERMHGPWTEAARGSGVPVQLHVVEADDEAVGLERAADELDAEMIVVGVHGSGKLTERLLGSTTYKLSHRTTRPVVIVPPEWSVDPAR